MCALCLELRLLRDSHIIPKFVFRWLKKTSPTGHMRRDDQPDLRQQDGLKMKLLCDSCEGKINRWEAQFANAIFYSLIENYGKSVGYEGWLRSFCISLSWRMAVYAQCEGKLGPEWRAGLERWRQHLLENDPCEDLDQFLWALPPLTNRSELPDDVPVNWNRFVLRSHSASIASFDGVPATIVKLGRFLFIGFAVPPTDTEQWSHGLIHVSGGYVGGQAVALTPGVFGWLVERATRNAEFKSKMSDQQWAKLSADVAAASEAQTRSSDEALKLDRSMFGEMASLLRNS